MMNDAGLIGGAGNQFIIDFLNNHQIADVPGYVYEIGVFTGATTKVLGEWAKQHGKRVWAVDPFDIVQDLARAPLYQEWLNGRSQIELFNENTANLPVDVIMQTSQAFWDDPQVWASPPICAILIDGCHEYETVKEDLLNGWRHLGPGGVMLVHDYGHDIPDVTRACDEFRTLAGNGGMTVEVLPQFVMIAFIKTVNHVA